MKSKTELVLVAAAMAFVTASIQVTAMPGAKAEPEGWEVFRAFYDSPEYLKALEKMSDAERQKRMRHVFNMTEFEQDLLAEYESIKKKVLTGSEIEQLYNPDIGQYQIFFD